MTSLFFLSVQNNASALTFTNQNVTAYTAPSGNLTYHQTTPVLYNTAAVRPYLCGVPTSGTKFKKGTIITTSTSLSFPDARLRNSFSVYDMGDVDCSRPLSSDFFDVYFGVTNPTNVNHANHFFYSGITYNTSP